jgi:hypothetical protein
LAANVRFGSKADIARLRLFDAFDQCPLCGRTQKPNIQSERKAAVEAASIFVLVPPPAIAVVQRIVGVIAMRVVAMIIAVIAMMVIVMVAVIPMVIVVVVPSRGWRRAAERDCADNA